MRAITYVAPLCTLLVLDFNLVSVPKRIVFGNQYNKKSAPYCDALLSSQASSCRPRGRIVVLAPGCYFHHRAASSLSSSKAPSFSSAPVISHHHSSTSSTTAINGDVDRIWHFWRPHAGSGHAVMSRRQCYSTVDVVKAIGGITEVPHLSKPCLLVFWSS